MEQEFAWEVSLAIAGCVQLDRCAYELRRDFQDRQILLSEHARASLLLSAWTEQSLLQRLDHSEVHSARNWRWVSSVNERGYCCADGIVARKHCKDNTCKRDWSEYLLCDGAYNEGPTKLFYRSLGKTKFAWRGSQEYRSSSIVIFRLHSQIWRGPSRLETLKHHDQRIWQKEFIIAGSQSDRLWLVIYFAIYARANFRDARFETLHGSRAHQECIGLQWEGWYLVARLHHLSHLERKTRLLRLRLVSHWHKSIDFEWRTRFRRVETNSEPGGCWIHIELSCERTIQACRCSRIALTCLAVTSWRYNWNDKRHMNSPSKLQKWHSDIQKIYKITKINHQIAFIQQPIRD